MSWASHDGILVVNIYIHILYVARSVLLSLTPFRFCVGFWVGYADFVSQTFSRHEAVSTPEAYDI